MLRLLIAFVPAVLLAQTPADLQRILERLDKLEKENTELRQEVRQLQERLGVPQESGATISERLDVQEQRVNEQAQSKVEASQKLPIRLTGMALFNAFLSGRNSGGADTLTTASATAGQRVGGATFRQTVVGIEFQSPATFLGGAVGGNLFIDFYSAGGVEASPLNNAPRIRTGSVEIDWGRRTLLFGQEKPIFSPREPNSLATIGVSPLTGAGNLWRWHPQVRYEERIPLGAATQLNAQVGVYQTAEDPTPLPAAMALTLARRRPSLQGRFELVHNLDENRRIAIAPGFHRSRTHVAAQSIPSDLVSVDWFANPWSKLEFSGTFWTGRNISHFGALRQGMTVRPQGEIIPVHTRGGWGQTTLLLGSRLTWNVFGGQHDDRNRDLLPGAIAQNRIWASNIMFRIAPNVIFSLEALQARTKFIGSGRSINNKYDLAVAYLF